MLHMRKHKLFYSYDTAPFSEIQFSAFTKKAGIRSNF